MTIKDLVALILRVPVLVIVCLALLALCGWLIYDFLSHAGATIAPGLG